MLHIILFILKILGCILLAVLGLLLVLLCILLFVPIKYDFSGSYMEQPDLRMKVTWLFGIVKAHVDFKDQQLLVQAKLAWKSLYRMEKDFTKKDSKEKDSDDDKNVEIEPVSEIVKTDSNIETVEQPAQKKVEQKPISDGETATVILEPKSSAKDHTKKSKQKLSKKDKNAENTSNVQKQSIFEKIMFMIEQLIEKISCSAEKVEEKIDDLSCRLNKIDRFISAECTQNSIALARRMLVSVLKHIAPKRVKGKIHFGLDKPSATGKILGYASAFYPLYADDIQIEPDFENKVIEGNLDLKGRIQLYIFVFWALRMILCKDVRKLIKYLKHLKK